MSQQDSWVLGRCFLCRSSGRALGPLELWSSSQWGITSGGAAIEDLSVMQGEKQLKLPCRWERPCGRGVLALQVSSYKAGRSGSR
jgi:hypothetical protein